MRALAAAALAAGSTAVTIETKQVRVGGFKCDGIQTANIYYPTDTTQTYPLLSFAHGFTEGGAATPRNYKDLLETTAAAGFVVIAPLSGQSALCYQQEKADQLRALEYVNQTSEFARRVDWGKKVGVYGHSMGGAASMGNAADAAAVAQYSIGAAVLNHPGGAKVAGGMIPASPWATSRTLVPTMYLTGSADTTCPPATVEQMYDLAAAPKLFAEMTGANHLECQSPSPHGWTTTNIHWFGCHLKGVQSECDAAYGVCTSGKIKMTKCVSSKGGE